MAHNGLYDRIEHGGNPEFDMKIFLYPNGSDEEDGCRGHIAEALDSLGDTLKSNNAIDGSGESLYGVGFDRQN